MKAEITLSSEFKRQFKQLAKKYRSLASDFVTFKTQLETNPMQGSDLGGGVRKIRMPIASKGKGKSGSARVLTLNILVGDNADVTLLTIYDKAEISSISDHYIKWLVEQYGASR